MTEFTPPAAESGLSQRDLDPQSSQQRSQLFPVDQQRIREMAPSLDQHSATLRDFAAQIQYYAAPDAETVRTAAEHLQKDKESKVNLNRNKIRRSSSDRTSTQNLVFSGGLLAASHDNLEEGLAATKAIYMQTTGGTLDQIFGSDVFQDGIVGSARSIFDIHVASQETVAEVSAATENDIGLRYELLKAFAARDTEDSHDTGSGASEVLPSEAVLALSAMAKSPIRQELASQLEQGMFDADIARDILHFVDDNYDVNQDLAKVRQFAKFVMDYSGTAPEEKAAFYERMISRLDTWPDAQFEVIQEARQTLLNSMTENFSNAKTWLENNRLISKSNPTESFRDAITGSLRQVAKQVRLNPQAHMILLRAGINLHGGSRSSKGRQASKRRGIETQQEVQPPSEVVPVNPEVEPEPMTLMTYDLSDYSTVEGVEAMMNKFIEDTRPGDTALREDLENMFAYMIRTDLPPAHRRGNKRIRATQLRFGEDVFDFSEFKPTEAAGLSLKTRTAKESRVYFFRPDEQIIAVIGIEPRSKQNEFINRIRNKLREHR